MLKLKFQETEGQKVYFTTDWHWHHNPKWPVPLWQARGYKSVEEHDTDIIETTNNIVRKNDILINLGDITLNCGETDFESLISQINCQNIHLLWGNHNSPCRSVYERAVKGELSLYETQDGFGIDDNIDIYPFRYKNIIFVGHYQEVHVNGQVFICQHFPLMIWDYMKHGAVHLCGHSHSSCPNTNSQGTYGKILDISWDEFKRPLSVKEINEIMNSKKNQSVDGHH